MEQRKIGKSSLRVAPFALGTNVFGWTIGKEASFRILDAFVDAGFNLIDTADVYSVWHQGNKGGESETIIGQWLSQSKKRDKVILATKVGGDMGLGKKCLEKNYIIKAAGDSLKRLQTDYIDLYQSHWDDETLPVTEPLEAYAQLIAEGKVKAIGASNFSGERLAQALEQGGRNGLPRYDCFQPEYNLYNRADYENTYEKLCKENEVGVICYYGLASGFLTGKYRNEADLAKSQRGGGIQKYLNPRGLRIIEALSDIASKHSVAPATIALAWLIARPSITAPIASATNTTQLQELLAAATVQLSREDIQALDEAAE